MNDLTKGNEGRGIFFFAIPMLIGSLFQQLYNTTDSIIVGRYLGKEAMAAVAGSSPITFLLVSLLTGVCLGFSILLSQLYGANNISKVKKTIDTAYIFIFFSSIAITILGILSKDFILRTINTPEYILEDAKRYLIFIFSGTLFSAGYNAISAILRGLGDSKTSLYFLIISTVINIVLDIVFIVNFNMGIEGVGLATVIAQGASFIFSLLFLNKKYEIFKLKLKTMRFDKDLFYISLKLGLPSGIQQMLFSIGNIALQSLVNKFGVPAMAAYGAGARIDTFITLPITNMGISVSTFVAQNIGAGKLDRVDKGVKSAIKISVSMSIFIIIIFLFFSERLVSLFNSDVEVIKIGSTYLKIVGPFYVFLASTFMMSSALRGAGHAFFAMLSSVSSLLLIRLPCAYFVSKILGVNGVWISIPAGWVISWFITVIYFKNGTWKSKTLIEKETESCVN